MQLVALGGHGSGPPGLREAGQLWGGDDCYELLLWRVHGCQNSVAQLRPGVRKIQTNSGLGILPQTHLRNNTNLQSMPVYFFMHKATKKTKCPRKKEITDVITPPIFNVLQMLKIIQFQQGVGHISLIPALGRWR